MLTYNDKLWKDYINHVLTWEGGKSSDPSDGAASCTPPGVIHTNKGVTFCTYKSLAPKFGLDPSHSAFLKLTNDNAAKFLYEFYKTVRGNEFPDIIGIYTTENAWGSGYGYWPYKHLFDAFKNLGLKPQYDNPIITKKNNKTYRYYNKKSIDETIKLANQINEKLLINELIKVRTEFLKRIAVGKNKKYLKGWLNRTNAFTKNFAPLAKNSPNIQPGSTSTTVTTQPKKKNIVIPLILIGFLVFYLNKEKKLAF